MFDEDEEDDLQSSNNNNNNNSSGNSQDYPNLQISKHQSDRLKEDDENNTLQKSKENFNFEQNQNNVSYQQQSEVQSQGKDKNNNSSISDQNKKLLNSSQNQQNGNFQQQQQEEYDEIAQPLFDKVNQLDQLIQQSPDMNAEEVLNIRKNQIVIIKMLVFVHKKDYFMLANAETMLGEAYLNFGCLDMAIHYLSMAEKRNQQFMNNNKERIYFQTHIYILLGKCYMKQQLYEDALDNFNMAQELQYKENLPVLDSIKIIAQCQQEMKNYDIAISQYNKALNVYQEKQQVIQDKENKQFIQNQAYILVDQAKAYALKEDFEEAIDIQQQAIDKFIDIQHDIEKVAEQYQTLSEYQKKHNVTHDYINSLNSIIELYKSLHGPCDKRVLKAQREISVEYLKQGNQDSALKSLYQTEKLEEIVYGKYSIQIGKTQKIIGSVLVLLNHYQDAKRYFSLALKCYEVNKDKKHAQELMEKIQFVKDLEYKQMYNLLEENQLSEDGEGEGEDDEDNEQLQQDHIQEQQQGLLGSQVSSNSLRQSNNTNKIQLQVNGNSQNIGHSFESDSETNRQSMSQHISMSKSQLHKIKQQNENVQMSHSVRDRLLDEQIQDYDLLEAQKILSEQKEIENLMIKVEEQLKQIFGVAQAKIYAAEQAFHNDDDIPEEEKQLYAYDKQKNEIIGKLSSGICGRVFELGDFQFLQSIYNHNVYFNSGVDLQTELPIICFTCYRKDGQKMGVIQTLDPQQIIGANKSNQQQKNKIQLKLFQFGIIFAENLKNFSATDV